MNQSISREVLTRWSNTLEHQLKEKVDLGAALAHEPYVFTQDDYESWASEAADLLGTADAFHNWVRLDPPAAQSELENLIETVECPPEPEPDPEPDYDEPSPRGLGDYWTIERLFEDL